MNIHFLISLFFISFLCVLTACDPDKESLVPETPSLYFPPLSGTTWETQSPDELNWNSQKLEELYAYLEAQNTHAFIILKDGKIVVEKYWGRELLNNSDFTQDSYWYWASAGKTITATLVGIAEQENLLNINDKTSAYLGINWTSAPIEKENLITIRHQLTMTTGLDYNVADIGCTLPSCLNYKQDAGTQWYYHNAPYTLLENVVENASGLDYNTFCDQKLEQKIGMSGFWRKVDYNNVYWSKPRDMARFGLLILNKGKWETETVLSNQSYVEAMTTTSQSLNPSYGYLWWLNGKSSVIYPSSPTSFPTSISPNAPQDLFAAMGKNGQIVDIVPSQNLVVVRMGNAPDDSLVPIEMHDEMWAKLVAAIPQ